MSGGKILFSTVPGDPSIQSVFDVLFNGGYWGQENSSEMEAGNIFDEWGVGWARKNTRRQPRSCKEQVLMIVLTFLHCFWPLYVCFLLQEILERVSTLKIFVIFQGCERLVGVDPFSKVFYIGHHFHPFILTFTNFHNQMKIITDI